MTNPNDKELNEVDWDKVWYGEFMTRLAHSDFEPCADIDGVLKIVAEAERRTWEAAADLVHAHDPSIRRKTSPAYWGNTLMTAINAKLSSLTKK